MFQFFINMKPTQIKLLLSVFGFLFLGLYAGNLSAQTCNTLSNVIPCNGFILGQEGNSFGQFTGSEEWLALGKAPFPTPVGDIPYGMRVQRNSAFGLFQVEVRGLSPSFPPPYDANILFGNVIPKNDQVNPPPSKMEFKYVLQNQQVNPPSINTHTILSLVPASSKQISNQQAQLCTSPSFPNCFGRVGIERSFPTYTLDVNGITRTTNLILGSDARYKRDVQTIEDPVAILRNLRGTTYFFREDLPRDDMYVDGGLKSGFIAQELERELPHLVYTDEQGFKSVDYIGVIPYLVEGFKELSDQNELLQNEVDRLNRLLAAEQTNKAGQEAAAISSEAPKLYQNVPNPFDAVTEISVFLPENTREARILVFDLNGRQLRNLPLTERGQTSIELSGSTLEAGMYLYSLMVNGQEVDTKRMILTK